MPKLMPVCHVVRRNDRPRFRKKPGRTRRQILEALEQRFPGITAKARQMTLRGW